MWAGGADARRGAGLLLRDALARPASCSATEYERRRGRRSDRALRRRDPARARVDEVAPRDDRHGRGLRIVAHGVETRCSCRSWSRSVTSGGSRAPRSPCLVSTVAFAAAWAVVLVRLRAEVAGAPGRGGAPRAARRESRSSSAGSGRPDVGGPASHAPALAAFLHGRGHAVEVVTTADSAPAAGGVPGALGARASCRGVRHLAAPRSSSARRARRADVVYATAMFGRAALGARARAGGRSSSSSSPTRRSSGCAARRRFGGTLDEFQRGGGGMRVRFLRATRDCGAARERRTCSARARTCGDRARLGPRPDAGRGAPEPGARRCRALPHARGAARATLGLERRTRSRSPAGSRPEGARGRARGVGAGAGVALVDRRRRAGARGARAARRASSGSTDRVRFLGRSAARAGARALSRGRRGAPLVGLGELPAHGRRGARRRDARDRDGGRRRRRRSSATGRTACSCQPGDAAALAEAIAPLLRRRRRFARRLAAAAAASVAGYSRDAVFARIDGRLRRARSREAARCSWSGGRGTRCRSSPSLARKFDALARGARRPRARAPRGATRGRRRRASGSSRPVRPRVLDGPLLLRGLPVRVARELRASGRDAVLAQGAHEAAARAPRPDARARADARRRRRARRLAAPTRLYGSPLRRALAPARRRARASRRSGAPTACGRSPTTRRASSAGSGSSRPATFAAFMDLEPFLRAAAAALPERPVALFVGVLERYKASTCSRTAWRLAAPRVPDALAARRRARHAPRRRRGARRRPARADALDGAASHRRRRTRARRGDGARAPLALGGTRARGRRGLLPRPRRRREPRRRHPGHRRGR